MSATASTVFVAKAERTPGTVHLVITTDQGDARLRFTPALAKLVGRELVQQADKPEGTAAVLTLSEAARRGQPLEKPRGGIG